jgi:type IV pilus assembly protein PilM
LSKSVLDSVSTFFKPQIPRWSCEFTSRHLMVTGVDSSRKRIVSKTATPLSGELAPSLSDHNLVKETALRDMLKEQLARANFKGSEIVVVIPDDVSRITFVNAENLPASREERATFLRWKLKKNMPFDVDVAQMSFKVLGSHDGSGNGKAVDVMVALSPRSVVREYEDLMQSLDLHAGFVTPSTLAVLNLYSTAKGDAVVVKIAPGCLTTTVLQHGVPRFYRRVSEMPLYDAVYPTIMYYQDKLGGGEPSAVAVCGYETDVRWELSELQNKLNAPVHRLGPANVEDIYKPALGAVNWVWADSV